MANYLSITEVLELVDEEYNYGQLPIMKELMKSDNIKEGDKHLVGSKGMVRFFQYHAEHMGMDDYHDYMDIIGSGTKAIKYNINDIYSVLTDPDIDRRIKELLRKKTTDSADGPVPLCIRHEYFKAIEAEKRKATLADIGYTEHQIKLLSVPDELLIEGKMKVEKEISDIKARLAQLETELADITTELYSRGIRD